MKYLPLLLLLIFACASPEEKRADIVEYIADPEHHLIHEWDIKGIQFALQYYPAELMNSSMEQLEENVYFKFSLSAGGYEATSAIVRDRALFSYIVQQLHLSFDQKITLETSSGDTYYPIGSWSTPTFGMSNENSVFIAFRKDEIIQEKSFQLLIEEFGLKTGTLYASYTTDQIESIPHL